MARVLYISYTGLMDPLGQSQVLQYVLGLAKSHHMTILTFEKPSNLADREKRVDLEVRCRDAGVEWHPRIWHNKPGMPATVYDIVAGIGTATRLSRQVDAQILHCRSYIGSLIGLAVKRLTGARLIFDMRGFWADERVDGGIWSGSGWTYRIFKRVERRLFLNADYVVSLTRAGVREFAAFDYLQRCLPPVSVIPTCTNLKLFRYMDTAREGFTLGYVGSSGSWYMFDDVARAVRRLFELRADARFLVLNKGSHPQIRRDLEAAGVDMGRVELREAPFDQVAGQIALMDAGIFFIKPAWSKRASCPTRMGEFLGCGKPCLTNDGVGDVREDFAETNTGITLPIEAGGRRAAYVLDAALEQLIARAAEPHLPRRCRAAAEERFSLEGGIAEYSRIYDGLAAAGPAA
jgi:glycosyltransferase involved in cell wall biosynthesis